MEKRLLNKKVIVTGGSRGIGEMIAEGFVKNGVKTFITSRKADQCNETAKRLSHLICLNFSPSKDVKPKEPSEKKFLK